MSENGKILGPFAPIPKDKPTPRLPSHGTRRLRVHRSLNTLGPRAAPAPKPERGSPPSPQAVKHGRDAVEPRFASLDVLWLYVAPGDRDPERSPRLCVRARRGREACNTVPALAAIALGGVERNRAQGASDLFREISIVTLDVSDDWSEDLDGFDRDVEDLKREAGRFGLHALPSERTVTAPRQDREGRSGAGAVVSRPGVQAKPPRHAVPC
jgi:hypothetical protein